LEMINVLTTRMFISENRQKEQENHITVLKAQVVSIQKKLELAQKSINTAPLVSQPPLYKEKVVAPVEQPPSKMTVEEDQLKEREGFDYGQFDYERQRRLDNSASEREMDNSANENPREVYLFKERGAHQEGSK
jgi:C1A family cysteine protease